MEIGETYLVFKGKRMPGATFLNQHKPRRQSVVHKHLMEQTDRITVVLRHTPLRR